MRAFALASLVLLVATPTLAQQWTADGAPDNMESVYQRRDGTWLFIGAQGTPSSAADAEPYN